MIEGPKLHNIDRLLIGQRIRRRRQQFGWSIETLAKAAGVAKYTLVRIENGHAGTWKTLNKIRAALRLWIDQIFHHEDPATPFAVHRASQARWYVSVPKDKYQAPVLDDQALQVNDPSERSRLGLLGFQAFFTCVLTTGLERSATEQALIELYGPTWESRHYGEEFVYCLHGKVTITIDGTPCTLSAGDALCFDALLPHTYAPAEPSNAGSEAPRLLIVLTSPAVGQIPVTNLTTGP